MNESSAATTIDEILRRLTHAVQRRFGAHVRIENPELPTLGGSNRTILFDIVEGATRRRLVMRQENYRLPHTPFLPPESQFQLLKLAAAHDIPVPEPIFEFDDTDGLERGCVMACVAGETMPRRLLDNPRFASARANFAPDAAGILARLHTIDIDQAQYLANTPDTLDPLQAQITRLDFYGEAHPALELAARWLVQNPPPTRAPCVIHGDFRTGNLIMNESRIAALLDWECAHLGDPMEEIGWVCLRAWRFGHAEREVSGFCSRSEFYAAYEAAGGIAIDAAAVRWWEIFGYLRWAVLNIMQAHGHYTNERRSPAFASCGRNVCLIEYDLLMTMSGEYT